MRALLVATFVFAACREKAAPAPEPPPPPELEGVVRERLAALERQVEPVPELPALEALDEGQRADAEGLVAMLSSAKGRMREVALESAADMGAAATAVWSALARDAQRPASERTAAAELLGAQASAAAALALVELAETAREAWLRSHAYWNLGKLGDDRVLLRLLSRLKYETDPEAQTLLAEALGALDSYAGVDVLLEIESGGADEGVRARARTALAGLAERSGEPDAAALRALWHSPDAGRLSESAPSKALELELWRRVDELSDEHFQLRGVDDARFALSHLGAWAVPHVAAALVERDAHTRLHAAQVLERTGARARAAGPALVAALDDPELAPAAAEALGAVGFEEGFAALAQRAARGNALELRVAAARGLGRTGSAVARETLLALFADAAEDADLRRTCASGLVHLGEGARVARFLAAELTGELGDPAGAERALGEWLERGAREEREGFAAALAEWRALDPQAPGNTILSNEAVRERRVARAAFLAGELEALAPGD